MCACEACLYRGAMSTPAVDQHVCEKTPKTAHNLRVEQIIAGWMRRRAAEQRAARRAALEAQIVLPEQLQEFAGVMFVRAARDLHSSRRSDPLPPNEG
ncbi:MAG: hypothetical protein QOH16_1969 [Gaiellaceae bacterium]|nr:hypothetical protein [Gaiellaceae bacterium]